MPGSQATSNDLYLLPTAGGMRVLKIYRTRDRRRRWAQERAVLKLWDRQGFPVPKVYELAVPDLREPYLVMSFVPGVSVQDLLRGGDYDEPQKLAMLSQVYGDMCRRHESAFRSGEVRLIHPDPNTGNIILCDGVAVWLDLENDARSHNLVDAAAAEICKLTCWAVRDLPGDRMDRVCNLICTAYRGHEALLQRVHSRPCERPFQFLHRWRDRRRKMAAPDEVTKYDVADALRDALTREHVGWVEERDPRNKN